jgi:hypothetical protein
MTHGACWARAASGHATAAPPSSGNSQAGFDAIRSIVGVKLLKCFGSANDARTRYTAHSCGIRQPPRRRGRPLGQGLSIDRHSAPRVHHVPCAGGMAQATSPIPAHVGAALSRPIVAEYLQVRPRTAQWIICSKCGVLTAVLCEIEGRLHAVVRVQSMVEHAFPTPEDHALKQKAVFAHLAFSPMLNVSFAIYLGLEGRSR